MILLYTLLLVFLGALKLVLDRRVASLERKYSRTAREADNLVREPLYKGGNSNRPDPAQIAKRQYLLGRLVQKRERLEGKYTAWQDRADRLAKLVARIRGWKGKTLPYTLGIVDVSMVLYLIDYFGVGHYLSAPNLVRVVTALISR